MTLQEIDEKILSLENEISELNKQKKILKEIEDNKEKEERLKEVRQAYANYVKLNNAYVNDYGVNSISKEIFDILRGLK